MKTDSLQLCVDRVAPEKAVHLEPPFHTIISRNTTRGIKMKHIALTQGKIAIVDDADYDELAQYKWYAWQHCGTYYAVRNTGRKPFQDAEKMHRRIMKAKKGQELDHINHCGLDNRRINLRFCTRSQNMANIRTGRGSSKYKGVSWDKRNKNWRARIGFNYKQISIGSYKNEVEAAKAYDEQAKILFGEFACLNFPEVADNG